MNKKAQSTLGITIIIGIMIFLIGMPIVNILKPEVNDVRGADSLDCTNSSISDGNRLTCLGVDLVIPYFILVIVSVSGGYLFSRFIT